MKRARGHVGRSPIVAERIRRIEGGFSFIPHRFLRGGFFASLSGDELLLYMLLVLAGDRNGVSYYGVDSLCTLLCLSLDGYVVARNGLIAKDLLAYDGTRFQVLSLPDRPVSATRKPLTDEADFQNHDPATIRQILRDGLGLGDAQ